MKPWELYNYQKDIDYRTNTFDYDWRVKVDNDERTIYVFSQFSTSVIDWIVNFLFFMIPQVRQWYVYLACLGWQTTFNSCKGLFMNEVLMAMNTFPDYKVVVCGHSYGGAGSVLAGIEIFFQGKVTQYAHWCDIVTYMPPLPGYWNVKVIRLGKFSFKGLFNPQKYHCIYGDESLYENIKE